MSRIGKKPVIIPANVTVNVAEGNVVTVKGPLGELSYTFHADMIFNVEGNVLTVSRPSDEAQHRALHGLTRTLVNNMVEGVSKGYSKTLDVNGVGYRCQQGLLQDSGCQRCWLPLREEGQPAGHASGLLSRGFCE